MITTNRYGPDARCVLILAHGAGAPMDSPFMDALATQLDDHGVACARFEFPYMQKRRDDGRKRPPDRQPVLLESFGQAIRTVRADIGSGPRLFIGGKSMGGRMATLLAAKTAEGIDGVLCFGYPFHAPGKPERWRTEHLQDISVPVMMVQGTRDPFGKKTEVDERGAIAGICRWVWLTGGNHDFQPPARQPETQADLIAQAAAAACQFMDEVASA
ncbi:MAG: alpha/beta hydrolase [Marinobacter sp. 34-60-7]|nr:MAG: alpha/beta hydrolase [Marinobacter sp. 34-60-7]